MNRTVRLVNGAWLLLKNAPVRASPSAKSFVSIGMLKFPAAIAGASGLRHRASGFPARSTTATTIVVGDTEVNAACTIASTSAALNVTVGLDGIGVGVMIGVPPAPHPAISNASTPAILSGSTAPNPSSFGCCSGVPLDSSSSCSEVVVGMDWQHTFLSHSPTAIQYLLPNPPTRIRECFGPPLYHRTFPRSVKRSRNLLPMGP